MANGLVTDIAGAVNRGLQFRQAEALRPVEQQRAQLGLQQQQQQFEQAQALQPLAIQGAELGIQGQEQQLITGGLQQQAKQQQIDALTEQQKNVKLATNAFKLQGMTREQQVSFLEKNIEEVGARDGNPADSIAGLNLLREGRFDEFDQGVNQIVVAGRAQKLLAPAAVVKQTTLERNLLAAGLKRGTPEFKAAVLKAIEPSRTVIGSGEKAESKALGKLRAERFGSIQETADRATTLLDNLNQLDAIDVSKGAFEPIKASFAAVIEGFGVDASGIANAAGAQSFNALSSKLVNEVLNAASGPQTDQDAVRARSTMASLGDTPAAAVFKNNTLRAVALRQIEQRDFVADQLDSDKNLSQANKAWREFKRDTPSLSSIVKGPDGLPFFFFQFKERARQIRSDMTDQEVLNAWRKVHGK